MIYVSYIDKYVCDVPISGIEMANLQCSYDLHSIIVLNMVWMCWSCNDVLFDNISANDG